MESATLQTNAGEEPPGADPSRREDSFVGFSVFGGPLHVTLVRLKLVRGTNSAPAGFVLAVLLWSVLIALATLEGILHRVFSLDLIAGHVRLLVAIPLLFVCESYAAPRMAAFARYLVLSRVVRGQAVEELVQHVTTVKRLRDAWMPDVACIAIAIAIAALGTPLPLPGGATDAYDPARASELTLTGHWYWFICLTAFRYLILRWIWALALWIYFLIRLSRLELALIPIHPDRAGGLGYLEVVHNEFSFLIFAISCVYAASFAESILAGSMTLHTLSPALCFVLIADLALFVGPLFVFSRKLWETQAEGMACYMQLAARYVNDFEHKWVAQGARHRDTLLGTTDLQSLADLGNSVEVVDNMRLIPAGRRLLACFAVAALAPMLPVALMLLPGDDIAVKLFKLLLGGE